MSETILGTTIRILHHEKPGHNDYLSSITCTPIMEGEQDFEITLLNGRPDHTTDLNIHVRTTRANLKRIISELSRALENVESTDN